MVSYMLVMFAPLTIKWRNFELFMSLMAEQTFFTSFPQLLVLR